MTQNTQSTFGTDGPGPSDTAVDYAVRCRGIVKDFGSGQTKTRVLHGIDLDVRFGEQTFIVGQVVVVKRRSYRSSLVCSIQHPVQSNAWEQRLPNCEVES